MLYTGETFILVPSNISKFHFKNLGVKKTDTYFTPTLILRNELLDLQIGTEVSVANALDFH